MVETTFEEALQALRAFVPTPVPCETRRTRMAKGDIGDCDLRRGKFFIRVSKELPVDFQVWVLIHEWAHARTWLIQDQLTDDHDAAFGVEWARCYRAVYD